MRNIQQRKETMATLILNNNSISVRLESEHVEIHRHAPAKSKPERETMPLRNISRVLVVGTPAISMPVFAKFLDRGIPCVFITKGGRWRGALGSMLSYNATRRMQQYDALRSPQVCLMLAREVVSAKLVNARRVIQRLSSNRSRPVPTNEHARALAACLSQSHAAPDLETLRGIEGLGSFHYFRLLAAFFPPKFPFISRSRHPPLDPTNALLSFAYSYLMNECLAALSLHGLDPALGFMHQDTTRSPALALDLMEPFRPAFADLLVLNLLNHNRYDPERHFQQDAQSGGWYLNDIGRQIFFPACEEALARTFVPRGEKTSATFRQVIDRQVIELIRTLEDGTPPQFFRLA